MQDEEKGRLDTLERENRRLQRSVEELSVLNDLAGAVGGDHDLEAIMQTIVHRSMRAVKGQQGVITLVRSDTTDPLKTLVRTMTGLEEQDALRFRHSQWETSVRSVLSVPMLVQSRLVGILTAYNKKENLDFSEEDTRLLSIIAAQSAQVVENARLYEEQDRILRIFARV